MKKRWVPYLALFAVVAGVLLLRPKLSTSVSALAVAAPPAPRERDEMEFIAKHGKSELNGARDWDGRTDGLLPEERPVEERTVEIPASAIWTGTDDTAPDGTASAKRKTASGEPLPETTSSQPATVRADAKKPPDPPEDRRRP